MSLHAEVRLSRGNLELDATVDAPAGEVVAVLGPNGAGKTTLLQCLSGLLPVDSGRIVLGDRVLDDVATGIHEPAEDRDIGMVPQDGLLFPHMDALDNIAFGLRARGTSRRESRRRAQEWLDRLGLPDRSTAKPSELSGGQAQLVALARALAPEPALLLLDEPLGALDAGTRSATRRELGRHLGSYLGATVLVTHDPIDALVLASRVVVIEAGRVTQAGPIAEVTEQPRSRYVAELVGTNLYAAEVGGTTAVAVDAGVGAAARADAGTEIHLADEASGPVFVAIAPNAVSLQLDRPSGSPRNRWECTVTAVDMLGARVRVHLDGPLALTAEVTPQAVADLRLEPGTSVWATAKATEITTYPR